jgi:hypothetical protein
MYVRTVSESSYSQQSGGMVMDEYQRALQLWGILAWAAHNRQILTYKILGQLISVPAVAVGGLLGPIQQFCLKKKIKPLTVIAVNQETGLPGEGFTAATSIPVATQQVFEFDWLGFGAPNLENLKQTIGV